MDRSSRILHLITSLHTNMHTNMHTRMHRIHIINMHIISMHIININMHNIHTINIHSIHINMHTNTRTKFGTQPAAVTTSPHQASWPYSTCCK